MNLEQTIQKLKFFINKDKFSSTEWEKRGLNQSEGGMSEFLNNHFNKCCSLILTEVKNSQSERGLKRLLKKSIIELNKRDYDTEEREFICDKYIEISEILQLGIRKSIQSWMYGPIISLLLNARINRNNNPKPLEVISQNCTQCNSKIEVEILQKNKTNSGYGYLIMRCQICGEYNLIVPPSNAGAVKFINLEMVEMLDSNEYTMEKAKIRLEQIKHFRK